MSRMQTIGILGAGKLGIVLAQLALRAGYKVRIAGSGDPRKIALTVEVLASGAEALTSEAATRESDLIILALPLSKHRQLSPDILAGKLVIDATNHWWEVDGPRDEFLLPHESSSEVIQDFLQDARVVKALSHMGYHDLLDEAKPHGVLGRKAIAIAGNGKQDVATVAAFVDAIGFDPVICDTLAAGQKFEPGGKIFGANVNAASLRALLGIKHTDANEPAPGVGVSD